MCLIGSFTKLKLRDLMTDSAKVSVCLEVLSKLHKKFSPSNFVLIESNEK